MDKPKFTPKYCPDQYGEMSVWDIYSLMTTIVSIKNTLDLVCRAQPSGETAMFEWAEQREGDLDDELQAIAANLAGRLGLNIDDEDTRDMAFARVDGFVPSAMWADGRMERMRTARELRKAGA